MKLVVVDMDRLKYRPYKPVKGYEKESRVVEKLRKTAWKNILLLINDNKVCTLTAKDFGKKTLMKLPRHDKECLDAKRYYQNAIFKLKDDHEELRHEDRYFRKIMHKISWFRIGVLLRREKAVKILLRLLQR